MSNVTSTTDSAINDLSIRTKQKAQQQSDAAKGGMGEDVFLKLMVTQMKNQNPLNPQDGAQFVAQLAQFSSVEGINNLNSSMSDLIGSYQSSQALQASSMVGRTVKVDSDKAYLAKDGLIAGTIDLPQSTDIMNMVISDSSGQQIAKLPLGTQEAGNIDFVWDGTDENGEQHGPGMYTFKVQANIDGEPQQLNTALSANVNSVTVGSGGAISLNVAGVGAVSMSDVREIL